MDSKEKWGMLWVRKIGGNTETRKEDYLEWMDCLKFIIKL